MSRHPSAYPSHVRVAFEGPTDTKQRMLLAFVDAGYPLTRLEAERLAFPGSKVSATWAASAVRELREQGYLQRARYSDTKFEPTDRGRAMAAVLRACDTPGGAA